jgi:uncharacterized protein DUF2630
MDDRAIHRAISDLIEREHGLRGRLQAGQLDGDAEQRALRGIEEQLDQCWDLLRRRDALRHADQDPNQAAAQPPERVEGYLQ